MAYFRMNARLAACLLLTACAESGHPSGAPVSAARAIPGDSPPEGALENVARAPVGDASAPVATTQDAARLSATSVLLPGATPPVSIDYIAYDRARGRVWVPVGDTGSVDVLDVTSGSFTRVDGFKTAEREVRGQKRTVGPSAVAIGDGYAYIGNRATSEICTVDSVALKLGSCVKLTSPTDGVAYVASAKEVWVTTPRDHSIVVLDASAPETLKTTTTIRLDGAPEGYAVDDSHGVFFTNLEDKNRTVVIDVKSHRPKATWSSECGPEGPRGIAVDASRSFVFVGCTDHVQVLDASRDGAPLAVLDTGGGVDNIDWLESRRLLYVAAGKAVKLTVARFDDRGRPTVVASGPSSEGARNGVADVSGNAYAADAKGGRMLVFRLPSVGAAQDVPNRASQ